MPAKLTYPCFEVIIPYMDYNQRLAMSIRCPAFRYSERKQPVVIDCLEVYKDEIRINEVRYQIGIIANAKNGKTSKKVLDENEKGGRYFDSYSTGRDNKVTSEEVAKITQRMAELETEIAKKNASDISKLKKEYNSIKLKLNNEFVEHIQLQVKSAPKNELIENPITHRELVEYSPRTAFDARRYLYKKFIDGRKLKIHTLKLSYNREPILKTIQFIECPLVFKTTEKEYAEFPTVQTLILLTSCSRRILQALPRQTRIIFESGRSDADILDHIETPEIKKGHYTLKFVAEAHIRYALDNIDMQLNGYEDEEDNDEFGYSERVPLKCITFPKDDELEIKIYQEGVDELHFKIFPRGSADPV